MERKARNLSRPDPTNQQQFAVPAEETMKSRQVASSSAPSDAAARAFGSSVGEVWKSVTGLSLPLPALSNLQRDYVNEAAKLWNQTVARSQADAAEQEKPLPDRRFAAPEWLSNPATAYAAQMYLLNARTLLQMAESLEGGDEKTRQRVRFAVQQWVDAAAPSNFLALNPEAQRKALETKGESIAQGLQLLWNDVQQGHLSQTDERGFEIGRNVATHPARSCTKTISFS